MWLQAAELQQREKVEIVTSSFARGITKHCKVTAGVLFCCKNLSVLNDFI